MRFLCDCGNIWNEWCSISRCQLLSLYLESSSNSPCLEVAVISWGETNVTYCIYFTLAVSSGRSGPNTSLSPLYYLLFTLIYVKAHSGYVYVYINIQSLEKTEWSKSKECQLAWRKAEDQWNSPRFSRATQHHQEQWQYWSSYSPGMRHDLCWHRRQ